MICHHQIYVWITSIIDFSNIVYTKRFGISLKTNKKQIDKTDNILALIFFLEFYCVAVSQKIFEETFDYIDHDAKHAWR